MRASAPDLKTLSDLSIFAVLDDASREELTALTKVLDPEADSPIEVISLVRGIGLASGNAAANTFRGGQGISYSEVLYDAAKTLEIEGLHRYWRHSTHYGHYKISELDQVRPSSPISVSLDDRVQIVYRYVTSLERAILAKLMLVAYENATPEQRRLVDRRLAELAKTPEGKDLAGLKASAALMVAGNLGGFATYTMMSTVLSAVSVGTLGFGAYTFASSALSVFLGPVGWLGLATAAVYKLGSPSKHRVIRIAATCALIAERLRMDRLGRT